MELTSLAYLVIGVLIAIGFWERHKDEQRHLKEQDEQIAKRTSTKNPER